MWRILTGVVGFDQKHAAYPLADEGALRQIVANLPADNPCRALKELAGWLEALTMQEGLSVERMVAALRCLDGVADEYVDAVTQVYLHTLRPERREEVRQWKSCHGYWLALAHACEFVLVVARQQPAQCQRPALAWLCARLIGALANSYKWKKLRYGPVSSGLWQRAGQALLLAEELGVAGVPSGLPGGNTANREYSHLMVLHIASLTSLSPAEMHLAEKVLIHFLPLLVFSSQAESESTYWIDLTSATPPQRIAQRPDAPAANLRFLRSTVTYAAISDLLAALERGALVPAEIKFDEKIPGYQLLPVLRHLVEQLAPTPPTRTCVRHRVRHRMTVVHGLPQAWQVFAWRSTERLSGQAGESWVVENVSRGGLGARLVWRSADWLKIGVLLSFRPGGGENWLLGCVRRCQRERDGRARVGIEVLGRQVRAIDFRLGSAAPGSPAGAEVVPGLLILDGNVGDHCRVVLPAGTYDQKASLVCPLDGACYVLVPDVLLEQGGGFALARYRCPELLTRSTGAQG
ncbi:MAG: hypothetical protein PHT48_04330 [Dechloromonas sp.]|nr:hypothetical protein [Dechloromonas sp.]